MSETGSNPQREPVGLFALNREMGFTRKEFLERLPRALANYEYRLSENRITADVGQGRCVIDLGQERERVLSPLVRFPILPVDIRFDGVGLAEQRQFIACFDAIYMKGLG